MAEIVYLLCAFSSLICSLLLLRSYRRHPTRLILWSAACFLFLAANNVILFIDLILLPNTDLLAVRTFCIVAAVITLLYGLIWEIA